MDSKTSANPSSPQRTQVKKENEEEIKEFAETAMNELLGWYGYERLELRRWAASRARDGSSPEQTTENKNKADECSWCNKNISTEGGALQQAGATFCSELCFSQSRRANFKRAKTCDWCRHVRHTVAYVDFQDGATQLQFCSDKCLNQYKMHIFCRETQAHLDLNPHLVNASSSSNLITPELWLKNCKSRSASPNSERSGSPNVENVALKASNPEKLEAHKTHNRSPIPLISVAPTAKLMKQKRPSEEALPILKSPESKKESKTTRMNLRKRRTSKCSSTVTSQTVRQRTSTPKAQDLRICSPSDGSSPASSTIGNVIHSPPHPINPHPPAPPFPNNPMFSMPPPMFMENHESRHTQMFPPRFNFMPRHGIPMERPRLPPPLMNFPPAMQGQAPPVTVLVPYPVVLPIPLPIPIPIPLSAFVQAHCANKIKTENKSEDLEGPLDFTMNSDKKREEEAVCSINGPIPDPPRDVSPIYEHNIERIGEDKIESETDAGSPEQTLPKFKITRLGNKMAKIVTKSRETSESTRPLRKRRRLVEVTTDDEGLIPKTRKIVEV